MGAAMTSLGLLAACGGHGGGARQGSGQRVAPESLTVAVDSDESAHDQVIEVRLDRLENELTHQQVIDKARADAMQAQMHALKSTVAELMRHNNSHALSSDANATSSGGAEP